MALPESWVEHLFAKLTVRYGVAFARLYPELDIALVKADWAEVLEGFDGQSLAYGLRYLPASPPNALQFRDICRRSPVAEAPRLEGPEPVADPGRVRSIMARLKDQPGDMTLAQRCAERIRQTANARGGMTGAQRMQLAAIERMTASDTPMGEFASIPVDLLPPAMREELSA